MARIPMTSGFTVIPEGTYVFKIESVEYKESFGKMSVNMVTKDGQKYTERFSFLKASGEVNSGAMNAFSFFAKTVLKDFEIEEIDDQDLVGHYIKCEIVHDKVESKTEPGKILTFPHIGEKTVADGFEGEAAPAKPKVDLAALLG